MPAALDPSPSLASIEDPERLNTLMLLLLGWYMHSLLMACSFLTCDAQDKKQWTDVSDERFSRNWTLIRLCTAWTGCENWSPSLFDGLEVNVHTVAWKVFDTFVKVVSQDGLELLVVPFCMTIEGTGPSGRMVPGSTYPRV